VVTALIPHRVNVASAAGDLLAGLLARPWGQVSASVYETGRLVVLAPDLAGQAARLDFLVDTQSPAGDWGAPDGYALVPTLSATDALLCALARDDPALDDTRAGRVAIVLAADRGLLALLDGDRARQDAPDMPARELIVPSLITSINARLSASGTSPARLRSPAGSAADLLSALSGLVAEGAPLDVKLLHALEVTGPAARGSATARPTRAGAIGASPAATAAWLGPDRVTDPGDRSARYLAAATELDAGPVGCTAPITVFERSWVLATLARAGLVWSSGALDSLEPLAASLREALGPDGAATGPGLPADADTTAVTLFALTRLGHTPDPVCLMRFSTGTHFRTWPGEQGVSTTVNAHVLDALGAAVTARPDLGTAYQAIMTTLAGWLANQQNPAGWWRDRWHASDYYATACCVLALDDCHHLHTGHQPAVTRAVDWVLRTRRPDGSWGRWTGTAEETAYAVLTLLRRSDRTAVADAVRSAYPHLVTGLRRPPGREPALWHDKDLYRPHAIVRAAILAAIDGCQSGP
jgi:halimadienyl-diphosphate synthase